MKQYKQLHEKFTDEEFIKLAEESHSMSEFVLKLGYASGEGTHSRQNVKARCLKLGINPPKASNEYMGSFGALAGTIPIEKYFVKGTPRTGHVTRTKILKYNLLPYRCVMCGNTGEWNGKPITLEIDHINGDHLDNRLDNIRFLCPNCHSQTETFRGKKRTDY